MGNVLASHVIDLGSRSSTNIISQAPPGVLPKHIVMNNLWAQSGVSQAMLPLSKISKGLITNNNHNKKLDPDLLVNRNMGVTKTAFM